MDLLLKEGGGTISARNPGATIEYNSVWVSTSENTTEEKEETPSETKPQKENKKEEQKEEKGFFESIGDGIADFFQSIWDFLKGLFK